MSDSDDQEDEITALSSIYEERVFTAADDKKGGQFVVNVTLPENFHVQLDGPVCVSVALKAGTENNRSWLKIGRVVLVISCQTAVGFL